MDVYHWSAIYVDVYHWSAICVDVYHWSVYVGYVQISQLNTLMKQVLDVAKATIEAASVLMATQDSTSAERTRTNMEVSPASCAVLYTCGYERALLVRIVACCTYVH